MRRAERLDGLQPDEAADAVVGMDDDVAGRERRRLGDEVGGALALLGAPHQPVAENVLFGDDDETVGLEAGFERQHGQRRPARHRAFRPRRACATWLDVAEPVLGQDLRQAVERAFGPAGDQHLALGRAHRGDVVDRGLEDVGVRVGALLGKTVAAARAGMQHLARRRHRARRTAKTRSPPGRPARL